MRIPHLSEQESVRAEAAAQYGGLSDAAAMIQAHKAMIDPNVTQAHLRKMDVEETAKVKNDLGLAQAKIDDAHGKGTYRVLDAVVRGDALSTVCEDELGNTYHVVVGWNDRWRPILHPADEAAARAQADTEAARSQLSAEFRSEVERRVAAARDEITADLTDKFDKALADIRAEHEKVVKDAAARDADADDDGEKGPTEATGGNEEGAGAKTRGEPTADSGGGDAEVTYPRTHDDLDALAAKNNFEWPDTASKVDEKIEALRKAGIAPAEE